MNISDKDINSTYTLNSTRNEDTSFGATKSFLGDLPPLGQTSNAPIGKNPGLSLAPLKKIPPVAKVEATKKEGIFLIRVGPIDKSFF